MSPVRMPFQFSHCRAMPSWESKPLVSNMLAVGAGNVVEPAVGEHAVHVHQEQLQRSAASSVDMFVELAGFGMASDSGLSLYAVYVLAATLPPRAGPVGVEEFAARLVDALVGVRAEVVALGLQQVGGQPLRCGSRRRTPGRS